jgi:hypothetical protein
MNQEELESLYDISEIIYFANMACVHFLQSTSECAPVNFIYQRLHAMTANERADALRFHLATMRCLIKVLNESNDAIEEYLKMEVKND